MFHTTTTPLDRSALRADLRADEATLLDRLAPFAPDPAQRAAAARHGAELVTAIRASARPGLMEMFLAEYGLSTREGVALMTLAEALLRVPDRATADALIADKIGEGDWTRHRGGSPSRLVNAATEGLALTRGVLGGDDGLRAAVKRLGAPVIRAAVTRAMREMGDAFVLGRDMDEALRRGRAEARRGYTYSYDMLGEAAMTAADAAHFDAAYSAAIARLATEAKAGDIRDNPGISIKLSALHPRYVTAQRDRVMAELVPIVTRLARAAREARMGFNIDAEEQNRLELSLDVIEAVLPDPALAGWDGFGVVVQAYGKRAPAVLDWLHALAERHDRRIMVRLVKGAYWDTEIKRAQVDGVDGFPVFTRKAASDVAFLGCAGKLLAMRDRIYPQFATHNAHTVAAILAMTGDRRGFEFQRLHGMGEALHEILRESESTRCRIYAPVGPHKDLLAYLARRMLENGANSSFVNQVVDPRIAPEAVAADPWARLEAQGGNRTVVPAPELYLPERRNSAGADLQEPADLAAFEAARARFAGASWEAGPLTATEASGGEAQPVANPARPEDQPGIVREATPAEAEAAVAAAVPWDAPAQTRAAVLEAASDLYETHSGELCAILAREAGKTPLDALGEVREAVDFLRYYAARGRELGGAPPLGIVTAISPWNFPLAIFTGQIAGALVAGNAVLAKPAETTPLVAHRAVRLLHEAGIPHTALQLLPGPGGDLGAVLAGDPRVAGVVFTGSTATAQAINRRMAEGLAPSAPLIAETGGINAMIVDSTALPEQVVRDVLASAFQSAGQRCSALRCLYLQEDVAEGMLAMLKGAMDELRLGDPWDAATDVGPVIDDRARQGILAHVARARAEGRVIHELAAPPEGHFVAPAMIRVSGIEAIEREVFGPVLHVATFAADEIGRVIEAVNASGYGLTFALHSRMGGRVEATAGRVRCGNIYVNRNQIGAVVGVQPFGGEGLSGTGPKAGGPDYVAAFTRAAPPPPEPAPSPAPAADPAEVARRLAALPPARPAGGAEVLPGPTGELNRLARHGRGAVLCLGPTAADAAGQAAAATAAGSPALQVTPGARGPHAIDGLLSAAALTTLPGIAAVAFRGEGERAPALRRALAAREGAILPLLTAADIGPRMAVERHLCIDTTAAGGNTALLSEAG
ncbi:bifunctional proline dehydrogenase/L-glutamate gamma-semialdehyde dehydrogenase PutA [Paracoccus sp. S-4012]|uniref:bifunctional proline dehydrogenase/L-glutamate gamma-semialdehyde dehydrogenase PutA n=1 Tax=Paracoccus sp. S-4012 TaxID=2665648 RepID=UPI0012B0BECF|nr:bifunctional proline dehydrogenase/L-glutamate gamma-semialdehyde dehydrogenase PutA [Paracoccus sp. S-4012]MRX51398.1 bifunctional proline dehydrogenase/L-glutamate gamma-semialdehyde dehydrogenase PutA [Paracoccus sp. S-4012]